MAELRNNGVTSTGVSSSSLVPDLVDLSAWQRYCALLNVFKLFGGFHFTNVVEGTGSVIIVFVFEYI